MNFFASVVLWVCFAFAMGLSGINVVENTAAYVLISAIVIGLIVNESCRVVEGVDYELEPVC